MSDSVGYGRLKKFPLTEKKISNRACNVFKEFQENKTITDAEIIVTGEDGQEVSFAIHRVIMCGCSPFLKALLTNQMKETHEMKVRIPDVSPTMMRLVIDYAYTREVEVNAENVQDLIPIADRFDIAGLVEQCCEFMESNLTVENCLGIRQFADHYSCIDLRNKATRFALFHFVKLATVSDEVLELSAPELIELLANDELNTKNEEIVFELIVRWIARDEESRIHHIAALMNTVRLGLIPDNSFMEKIKSHKYIKDRKEVKPLIIRALRLLYDLELEELPDMDICNPLSRPRVPHEVLFVVGGWSGGSPTNVVETYDTRADRWVHCAFAQDAGPRAYHGCAALNGQIYVVGGFDGMDYFNSVRCFNPVTKTWREVAPMNSARCYVSVAVVGGCIYAMGGFNGQTRLNTAERYTPVNNQWSLVHPMNMNRSDANGASLQGKIYIVGGFNGTECMNSAEVYDPVTDQWTLISNMRHRRSGVSCIGYHGCIYAVGGFNGITRMNSAEKYDPVTREWTLVAEMYNPRSNFAIEVVDDLLFVIGGFNGVTTIFNVECYDDSMNEWIDASDMNLYKSALSACVISDLGNIRDFLHSSRQIPADKGTQSEGGDNERQRVPSQSQENQEEAMDVAPNDNGNENNNNAGSEDMGDDHNNNNDGRGDDDDNDNNSNNNNNNGDEDGNNRSASSSSNGIGRDGRRVNSVYHYFSNKNIGVGS